MYSSIFSFCFYHVLCVALALRRLKPCRAVAGCKASTVNCDLVEILFFITIFFFFFLSLSSATSFQPTALLCARLISNFGNEMSSGGQAKKTHNTTYIRWKKSKYRDLREHRLITSTRHYQRWNIIMIQRLVTNYVYTSERWMTHGGPGEVKEKLLNRIFWSDDFRITMHQFSRMLNAFSPIVRERASCIFLFFTILNRFFTMTKLNRSELIGGLEGRERENARHLIAWLSAFKTPHRKAFVACIGFQAALRIVHKQINWRRTISTESVSISLKLRWARWIDERKKRQIYPSSRECWMSGS